MDLTKHLTMKQFVLFAAMTLGLTLGSPQARAGSTNALTVRMALTALIQQPELTVTNTPTTNTTFAVSKVKFGTADFLKLLAAEHNQSFPDGAQLGLTPQFRFVVLNKAGDILLDVSTNGADSSYVFSITNEANNAITGKAVATSKQTTEVATEVQPDFGIYYADGKGNKFHFGGLLTIKVNAVVNPDRSTLLKTVSLLVPSCSGDGTFFNPNDFKYDEAVFTGTWGASGTNLRED